MTDAQLAAFADEVGATIGRLQRRVAELEARLAASEETTLSLYVEIEARIGALELRPVVHERPKLLTVIEHDAA
jgi:hypothetical protein